MYEVILPRKKIEVDPDDTLEWLIENGYVEDGCTSEHPYRIAMDPETSMTYNISKILPKFAKRFGTRTIKCLRNSAWRRELYKCFDVYQIYHLSQYEKCQEQWYFKDTHQKLIEQRLGIDLDEMNRYDLDHRPEGSGGKRWESYWKRTIQKYGVEEGLSIFKMYFDRRSKDLSADLRVGKPRSVIGKSFKGEKKRPYRRHKEE